VAARRDIQRLQEELDELFEGLWRGPRFIRYRPGFRPHLDTFVTDDPRELTIVVELAGVDPDQLEVVVSGDVLIVSGRRDRPAPERGSRISWHQVEIPHGPFLRRVRLPDSADAKNARATYERGLLTVVLPLAPQLAPQGPVPIEVTVSP
jgi:HSP20 family protein